VEENYLPVVVGAAVLGDRVLRLLFSDGPAGDVDFLLNGGRALFRRWTTPPTSPRSRLIPKPGPLSGLAVSTWRPSRCMSRRRPTRSSPPDALACLALVRALQQWPTRPLPGIRAGDAAAGTFADGHYTRRYAIRPLTAIG
jgi:hypothetical protein